jgi:hypothetical protein
MNEGGKDTRKCGGHHKENVVKKALALYQVCCGSLRFGRLKLEQNAAETTEDGKSSMEG